MLGRPIVQQLTVRHVVPYSMRVTWLPAQMKKAIIVNAVTEAARARRDAMAIG